MTPPRDILRLDYLYGDSFEATEDFSVTELIDFWDFVAMLALSDEAYLPRNKN